MAPSLQPFPQNVIAVIWDFDKTLIPGYMQKPLFEHYGVDERTFWDEVNALPAFYEAHGVPLFPKDIGYLSHVLTYIRDNKFADLSNHKLRELGGEIDFFPGLPGFFGDLKHKIEETPRFKQRDIKLEHYIVSTGLRQMILGSQIAEHVDGIWACELLSITAPAGFSLDAGGDKAVFDNATLTGIAYAIDNTTKTRALFEINKGVNKHREIDVNARMAQEARRVPFQHMIYIADGPSDVPSFSVVKQYGGRTFAVYPSGASGPTFRQFLDLQDQERVHAFGPADYRPDTHTVRCITGWAEEIAEGIASRWETALSDTLGRPPTHVLPPTTSRPEEARAAVPEEAAATEDGK